MEWNKDLNLEEVIKMCSGFVVGEISQEELFEWSKKIKIRFFIPTSEKKDIVTNIINDKYYSDNVIEKSVQLEINKFWFLMLEYTNILIDEKNIDLLTEDVYNVVFPCLYGWLYDKIKIDYNVSEHILENCLNYLNLLIVTNSFGEVNETSLSEIKDVDKQILELLKDKETLSIISDILKNNKTEEDELAKKVNQKKILEEINKKDS